MENNTLASVVVHAGMALSELYLRKRETQLAEIGGIIGAGEGGQQWPQKY